MALYGIFLGFGDLRMITETILLILEIVGTIAFAVSGAFVAIKVRFDIFGVVVIGCVTSFGGGVLRDVLTETPPYIFKKHVYALASITGGALYYGLRLLSENTLIVSCIAMAFIIVLRLLARKYRWSLPKIHLEQNNHFNK